MQEELTRHRITATEFLGMIDAGVLDSAPRLELLNGELIEMDASRGIHSGVILVLVRLFKEVDASGLGTVRTQMLAALSQLDVPEPDFLLTGPLEPWTDPTAADCLLVVEVSNTSVGKDRVVKAPIYAAAGIPEYWIVNIPHRLIEVHTAPVAGSYSMVHFVRRDEEIACQAFPQVRFRVDALFPPERAEEPN